MAIIYKYPLPWSVGPQTVAMPLGAQILHCGVQADTVTLWVLVSGDVGVFTQRTFRLYATGAPGDFHIGDYVGTVFVAHTVWHVFEVTADG